ncbi:MAG: IPTL-CTERM sorting domain-containing protein, partial [Acidobacteria bacterium]|nr:IPTL-CTERM sorting domain-containing protein [Acidobacteriota bacterium]
TFPEQISQIASGNVLVANFSGTQEGVVELDPAGMVVGTYDPASLGGYRGAYELPNGNILTTNGSGVHEIDRSGNLVETKISGVSARFIELVGGDTGEPPVPALEIPTLSTWGLVAMVLALLILGGLALRRLSRTETGS